jgi:hypothetical protein
MHFLFSGCSSALHSNIYVNPFFSLSFKRTGPRLLFWAFIKWSDPPSQGAGSVGGVRLLPSGVAFTKKINAESHKIIQMMILCAAECFLLE